MAADARRLPAAVLTVLLLLPFLVVSVLVSIPSHVADANSRLVRGLVLAGAIIELTGLVCFVVDAANDKTLTRRARIAWLSALIILAPISQVCYLVFRVSRRR